jgi:putative aldouronate transport system substrate-binding protein
MLKKGLMILMAALALAACGERKKTASARTVTEVSFPLEEKITLSYWAPLGLQASRIMSNYNGSLVYQELEKLTNVNINWIHPAQGQENEQFNLMIVGENYPDLITGPGLYPGGIDKGIEDGVFLELNDLIKKFAPNYARIREINPDAARGTISDSGKIGAFYPILRQENPCWVGLTLRKDWLEEAGLPIPVTVDDWDKTLRAFKQNHPDSVPLIFDVIGLAVNFRTAGIDGFGLFLSSWNIGPDFYREGDTVKYGPVQDPMRHYLALMNRWYKDGLIDKDFPARDARGIQTLVASGRVGAASGSIDVMNNLFSSQKIEWVAAPYPVQKPGDKIQYRAKDWVASSGPVAISSRCMYPEVAVKWIDYAYSDEGSMLFNFGIEGETYTMVDGKPEFTDLVMKNPTVQIESAIFRFKMHAGPHLRWGAYSNPSTLINKEVMDYKIAWTENTGYDLVLNPVSLTASESRAAADILNMTNMYRNEMFIRFIMGETPLDEFSDFQKEMRKMGIDKATAYYQAAYERFMKR